MKCSDVERVLPDIIDGAGDGELSTHLKSCPGCAELVSDLKLIATEARGLGDDYEPPARVWVRISNQLREEGIIREPETAPARPLLVPRPARRWSAWWLAPVSVAIVAAGAYQLGHRTTPVSPQVAQQPAPPSAVQSAQVEQPPSRSSAAGSQEQQLAQNAPSLAASVQSSSRPGSSQPGSSQPSPLQPSASRASTSGRSTSGRNTPASALDSATGASVVAQLSSPADADDQSDDQDFLSQVSTREPAMRATYEKQLRAVNTEIRETQEYIRRHPGDLDARQHLLEAFQQKAMLYQMALDRIQ